MSTTYTDPRPLIYIPSRFAVSCPAYIIAMQIPLQYDYAQCRTTRPAWGTSVLHAGVPSVLRPNPSESLTHIRASLKIVWKALWPSTNHSLRKFPVCKLWVSASVSCMHVRPFFLVSFFPFRFNLSLGLVRFDLLCQCVGGLSLGNVYLKWIE